MSGSRTFTALVAAFIATAVINAQESASSLRFVENKGQLDERARFNARHSTGTFMIPRSTSTV